MMSEIPGKRRSKDKAVGFVGISMKLGTSMPEHLIGSDPGAFRDFLRGVEDLGYGYVTIGEHILGADLAVRPDWRPYMDQPPIYDIHTPWHEPMVLFGYMAAITQSLEFSTGILVSPLRQAPLLAKQAAEVDILSGGRLRLVIAAGWNDVEFEGMGVSFADRGKILEEQMAVMRALWDRPSVAYRGRFHTLNAVGINPLPPRRTIPLWLGGQSKAALRRVGQLADGWFPFYPWFDETQLGADLDTIRQHAVAAGRDPAAIGIEGAIYFTDPRFPMPPTARAQPKTLEECVAYAAWWRDFGASRFWVTAPWADLGPEETGMREAGKSWTGIEQRLRALEDFKTAFASA
jgi:probable F420-dependent oxidoreductase